MIPLDVNNADQVANPMAIVVDLTEPNKQMVICSGIAIPEWSVHDDGTVYHESVTLNLRQTVVNIDQASVVVGLASIGNGKTNNLFSCDVASVSRDATSGELILNVDLALMGDPSALNRFGYQVVATVTTQKTGISGTIYWSKDLMNPQTLSVGEIAQLFQVSAGEMTIPPHGPTQLYSPVYNQLANGVTAALSSNTADYMLPYQIPGAPYGVALVAHVQKGPRVVAGTTLNQIAGPATFTLTGDQPNISGIDFRLVKVTVPR